MSSSDQPPKLRRIVTGHTADGTARVIVDDIATNIRSIGPGAYSTLMWSTDATPADIAIGESFEDAGARKLGTPPPPNGSRFAINIFPPGATGHMHRTETIDYAIVLEGEIDMELDDSTVSLRAGDVLIQRGTNHAWHNRSDAPAKVAFVLIDAKPLGIGKPVAGAASVPAT